MAKAFVKNVDIKGVSTCVPAKIVSNTDFLLDIPDKEAKKLLEMVGVRKKHVTGKDVCASDLCFKAAEKILKKLDWHPESIDLLVFISQTPDYFMPSTSCVLQKKLGLSHHCAAFDIGLGCSAYPYGLCIVSKMIDGQDIKRALLLTGDTPTKICHPDDRSTSLLFGDAGSATAIESSDSDLKSTFIMHSDGGGGKEFIVRAGGFRDRFSQNKREHFIDMNGANIFTFTLKRVPSLVQESLEYARLTPEEVDYFILHQANGFIIEHLRKKLLLLKSKVPIVIDRFGNTGGASVPLVITQGGLERSSKENIQLLLLGYGVGLSWASAAIHLSSETILIHSTTEV